MTRPDPTGEDLRPAGAPRRRTRRLSSIAAVLLLVATVATIRARGRTGTGDVPSVTVHAIPFARRVTADGNLRAVHTTPITVPAIEGVWGGMKLAWEAPDGSAVKAGDTIARFDGTEAEKQLRDARLDLAAKQATLREVQLSAADRVTFRRQLVADAARNVDELRRFGAKDPLLFPRRDIIEAELDERVATARHRQAERALDTTQRVSRSEVEIMAIDRQRAATAVEHAEAALDHLEVHAPSDGVLVLQRDDHGDLPKLGVRMSPDEPIGVIPVLDEMEAELFVLEVDGSGLEVDQPADVVVDSRPDVPFHGKIRQVDKLAKPRQGWVPTQYFSIVVALDHTDRGVMKPGQRAHATLTLDRRDAIVVPRQAVFDRNGKTIVYRRGPHGFVAVPVELGAATPGRIVVASGLDDGDEIALRDPTQALDQPVPAGSGEPKGTP
jgi:HlyD family secretion protein